MKKEKSKAVKILSIVGNVLLWLFIVFAVVITVLVTISVSNSERIPTIGNKMILTVQSNSMAPVFKRGDIILSRKVSDEEKAGLAIGDVITFDAGDIDGDGKTDLNTHRIVDVVKNDAGTVTSYITKGDNQAENIGNSTETVAISKVKGVYSGTRIPVFGHVLNALQKPTVFLLVIVIPLIAFFLFEVVMFIRKFTKLKNEGKKQITEADEELIKQRAVEEYIRRQNELKEQESKADADAGNDAVTAAEETVDNVQETPEGPAPDDEA